MSAKSYFGNLFKSTESTEIDLARPFVIAMNKVNFCEIKTELLFKKILESAYSRSEGAKDEAKIRSLFDSSEQSNASKGLISLVANAMTHKKKEALIYSLGVVKIADMKEKEAIEKDYQDKSKSDSGVLIDFRNYKIRDLIFVYMSLIYDIMTSMNTQVGLANALQIKINALRGTVALSGQEQPVEQAKKMNDALKEGKSILLDKNDVVETIKIDSASIKDAVEFVSSLIAGELGVSVSFVNGVMTSGMSATGEADANANEYCFQNFFNEHLQPICKGLYDWDLQFMTDDWRWFSAMAGNLLIVENSSLLSPEQKKLFANRLIPIKTAKK